MHQPRPVRRKTAFFFWPQVLPGKTDLILRLQLDQATQSIQPAFFHPAFVPMYSKDIRKYRARLREK